LLNDTPPNVAARSSFGGSGDVGERVAVAIHNKLATFQRVDGVHLLDEAAGAQTWSANCMMSISTLHDEHLIVGRPLALVLSIVMIVSLQPAKLVVAQVGHTPGCKRVRPAVSCMFSFDVKSMRRRVR